MKQLIFISALVGVLFISACDNPMVVPDPDPDPDPDMGVETYMAALPSWQEFSPQQASVAATPIGDPEPAEEVTLDVERVNEEGEVELFPDVAYSCQTQPFTLTANPEKIVLYSPDGDILWPGGLIQGKSHRDGLGALLGLPIAERTPIEVSIPDLRNDDNFRTVDTPSQAEVDQAIGSMIGNATAENLSTPSSISFTMDSYHSESQFALEAGISGNYMGFEGSAEGSVEKNASKTTITAHFFQRMFSVVVAPPQTPASFFNADFTSDKLQQQTALGRIGPDNLPVYISNVVYGRMMMFSMTSTASESDIRAAMSAAYEGIGGSVEGNLSVQHKSILAESEVRVTSLGGDAKATIAMIKSGNWAAYFTDSAPLTSASPLSYTFRNLGDGSIASVTETTTYNIKTCEARTATPGTFDLQEAQALGLGSLGTPVKSMVGDVNGDQNDDIIWNHVGPGRNETIVGISDGNGSFEMSSVFSHPGSPSDGWGKYDAEVGDFNNDGMTDIVWNLTEESNETFVALSDGSGSFTALDPWQRAETGWRGYSFYVGDVDGKDGDDLVWNQLEGVNRVYVSLSSGDGTFTNERFQDHHAPGWSTRTYKTTKVVDVTNDGRADIVWFGTTTSGLKTWTAVGSGDRGGDMFSFPAASSRGSGDWTGWRPVFGELNGRDGVDALIVSEQGTDSEFYTNLSNGRGGWVAGPETVNVHEAEGPFTTRLVDVNGDGRKDILLNKLGVVNRSFIGLSSSDGTFDFSRASQDHPTTDDWAGFEILVGDFNNDMREDIVYLRNDASNVVYVGLSK